MPTNVGAIDLMMDTKAGDVAAKQFDFLRPALREDSRKDDFPVEYMFKKVPYKASEVGSNVAQGAELLLPAMDRVGVERALIPVSHQDHVAQAALRDHPDRFIGSYHVNPNDPMKSVRRLVEMHERFGIKAATAFPCGYTPQVAINDKKFYPIYAKCIELDIPICVTVGVPGPRVPFEPQYVGLVDEVCYDFPELKFVMRHGAEPWTALAVKLMLKWPNLYYSTSAFRPKYYPADVVQFANTRGASKVMYAGYFPLGLSLDDIFRDMQDVPFNDDVWPKFLRQNAIDVFKLDP